MSDPAVRDIAVRAVRYDPKKLRLGQSIVPFAMLATIATRYVPGPAPWIAAAILQVAAVVTLLRGRSSLGSCTLRHADGRLRLATRIKNVVLAQRLNDWTIDGGQARLYATDESWRIRVAPADRGQLRDLLTASFGPPRELRERGSRRAQHIAAAVSVLGIGLLVVAFAYDIVVLGPIGMLCLIGGWGTHSALKAKIAGPKPQS